MLLSKCEQETIINFNAEDKTANIYAATPTMIRKMNKLLEQRPNEVKLVREDDISRTFEVPVKWVKIRPPKQLTDEQKQAMAERLKKLNSENR